MMAERIATPGTAQADTKPTVGSVPPDTKPTVGSVPLERVNTPPAQTWNYLRANDITLTVPKRSRKGDVYFALPRLFEKVECGMGRAVTDWVESQASDAHYVEVRAGERRSEPIVATEDTGVMVRPGAEATVIVIQSPAETASSTSAALVRIVAERGARIRLLEFLCGGTDQRLESVGIVAAEDARIDVRQFLLGAGTTALGLAVALDGDRARLDLNCRYLGRDRDVLDINHVVRQRGRSTRCEVRESGVLDGHACKSLRATIDLVHGSSGSEGAELESVLVLSDDVTNKTMPVILCDEDDVAGNHGASIGSIGPEQFQYLRDRGLSPAEAEQLYVRALFDEALIAAPTDEARQAVLDRASVLLGAEAARDLIEGLGLATAAPTTTGTAIPEKV